jgi:hypothetical protein
MYTRSRKVAGKQSRAVAAEVGQQKLGLTKTEGIEFLDNRKNGMFAIFQSPDSDPKLLDQRLTHPPQQNERAAIRQASSYGTVQRVPTTVGVKTATIATYEENRKALDDAVKAGAKQISDLRLKNTCEWFQEGKSKLLPLTPTHDANARAISLGSAGEIPRFPTDNGDALGKMGALTVDNAYKWDDRTDNNNIDMDSTTTMGWKLGDKIAVMDARNRDQAGLNETFKHEVQHAADLHATDSLDRYKSEFRAYSLQGGGQFSAPDTGSVDRMGKTWSNQTQYNIFKHVYDCYAYVKTAWDTDADGFKDKAVAFSEPRSLNPENSVRVDAFNQKLKEMTTTSNEAALQQLLTLIAPLTRAEAYFLKRNQPTLDLMEKQLSRKHRYRVTASLT